MKRMNRLPVLAAMVCLLLAGASAAWGAEVFSHSWGRVAFDTPLAFSKPMDIGMGAVALNNPPESAVGQGKLVITLVEVPKDMQEGMGNNPAEIIAYVKSTYLGSAKPAQGSRELTFLGQAVKGEVQQMSIPKPGEMEVYLVPLSGGDKMAVALTRDQSVPAEEAAKVMTMLAATFKEMPKK